jgi:predicted ATPase
MRQELESDQRAIDEEYRDRSEFARQQARMSTDHELGDLRRRYGEGLDAQSHGESFLALFQKRFVPDGLYLLD